MIQNIIDVNLFATIRLCRAFLKNTGDLEFRRDYNGRISSDYASDSRRSIINISSLLALKGGAGATTYAASKAGVLAFTRALVAEQGHRVRVNAIVPGYIQTPMLASESKS